MVYSEKCHKEPFSNTYEIRSRPLYVEKVIINILNPRENGGNRFLGSIVI